MFILLQYCFLFRSVENPQPDFSFQKLTKDKSTELKQTLLITDALHCVSCVGTQILAKLHK